MIEGKADIGYQSLGLYQAASDGIYTELLIDNSMKISKIDDQYQFYL